MFHYIKKITPLCFLLIALCAPNSHANTINAGVGIIIDGSPYTDHENTYLLYPLLDVKTDHIYVQGLSAGVFLWKNLIQNQELSMGLNFGLTNFDNSHTSNAQLKGIKDRNHSLNGYLRYMYHTESGSAGIRVGHDTLGNVDGFVIDGWYEIPIYMGPITFHPMVGLRLETQDRLRYYYGITPTESNKTGLATYKPDLGFTPYAGINVNAMIFDKINLFGGVAIRYLSSEIRNSPMVAEDTQLTWTLGVMYNF